MTELWVPHSFLMKEEMEARKAASDYDPNLDFGFNNETGQWCVFLKKGTMAASAERDLPILGFDKIPSRDYLQRRLYETDSLRRGHEVLDNINRHNKSVKDEMERKAKQADGELAEALEWGFRKMDSDKNPGRKVFFTDKGK